MADNSEKYFVKWCNYKLKPRGIKIESVSKDFNDGIKLVALLEEVANVKCPTKMVPPKNDIFKLQNLSAAMEMAKKMVKNLCVNGRNFISGTETDVKLILGFIFDLVLHYQVDDIDMDGKHGKDGLLMWCQKTTAGHEHVNIQNFASSWLDGMGFLALVHAYNGGCVDYAAEAAAFAQEKDLPTPQRTEKAKARMDKAFKLIEEQLGVEQILDNEFAEMPSDKANITYLSLIFKAFNSNKQKVKSLQVVKRTIDRARHIEELKNQLMEAVAKYHSDIKEASGKIVIEDPAKISEESTCQQKIKELFKLDRENNSKFSTDLGKITDTLDELNEMRELYGQQAEYKLIGKNSEESLVKEHNELHQAALSNVEKLKQRTKEIVNARFEAKKAQWKVQWDNFTKADASHQNITRDEFEQLLIACDQGIDENVLDGMFADGNKINFDDFVEVIDALENDKDTDEQCVISFSNIAGGMYIYERDLKSAGFAEADIKWLLSQMNEIDANGNVVEKPVVGTDVMESHKTGTNFTVEKMNVFAKKIATQHSKQEI